MPGEVSGSDSARERDVDLPLPLPGGCGPEPDARVDFRQLPRLIREGINTIWAAGPRDLIIVLVLQVISGVDLVALLILGRRGLDAVLGALQQGGGLAGLLPLAGAIAALVAFHMIVSSMHRERQQLVGELLTRHIHEQVLKVTTRAGLEAFDTPAFHNRVQRIQQEGHRPLELV